MSARTKISKSLQVGAYAPVVFQPGATGEHIKRAVTELGLTGVTICGETVTGDKPIPPDYQEICKLLARLLDETSDLHQPQDWTIDRWYEFRTSRQIALQAAREAGVL